MVIRCEDEGKLLAVLAKLELETDVKWLGGEKPTEHNPNVSFPVWLVIGESSHKMSCAVEYCDVPFDNIDISANQYLWSEYSKDDPVNHPSHYTQGKVECIDAMEETLGTEVVKGFCLGNCFKYLWRHCDKNGQEDIDKAVWYFDHYKQILNR